MARNRKKHSKYYLPWPTEAGSPYQDLTRLHKLLTDDIATSVNRGTEARNKFMIEAFIDYIFEDCRGLEVACQGILNLMEDERIGRPPKWYTLTDEIQDRVSDILELASKVKPALKRNELIYLKGIYDCLKAEAGEIEKLLAEHPYRPSLEVWEKTVEEAIRKLDR